MLYYLWYCFGYLRIRRFYFCLLCLSQIQVCCGCFCHVNQWYTRRRCIAVSQGRFFMRSAIYELPISNSPSPERNCSSGSCLSLSIFCKINFPNLFYSYFIIPTWHHVVLVYVVKNTFSRREKEFAVIWNRWLWWPSYRHSNGGGFLIESLMMIMHISTENLAVEKIVRWTKTGFWKVHLV